MITPDHSADYVAPPRRRYGVRFMPCWPHVSLGISAHLARKYGHLSIHLPIGVVIVGFTGRDDRG